MEHNISRDGPNCDPIERLLKLAGSRPQPDPERTAAFKRSLHAEWHRVTTESPPRRTFVWAAAVTAAGVAIIAVAWFPFWRAAPPPAAAAVLGHVLRSEGVVHSVPASGASIPGQRVTAGNEIPGDTRIETAATGRAALALHGGISLRLDVDTRIVLTEERVVRLERGAVYVDSAPEKGGPMVIHTENGEVRDIGTQFEVRMEQSSLRIRVREGEIVVSRRGSQLAARAGEALQIDRQGGHVRSTIAGFGPEWDWITAIAPQFQLEGATVEQFLNWVGREQGWRWRFLDGDTARRASGIVTHGSIEGYTPEEALAIVLPTCGLSFVRNRDEVVVSFLKEPLRRGE